MAEADDELGDEEIIYRFVRDDEVNFRAEGDRLIPSGEAFRDRDDEPSVDRAMINGNNPSKSQRELSDGVLRLIAADVRTIEAEILDGKGRLVRVGVVRVKPNPLPDNPAHALIYGNPTFKEGGKGFFRKVKARLSQIARWEIYPLSCRDKNYSQE